MVPWDECLKFLIHIVEREPKGTTKYIGNISKVCEELNIDNLTAQEIAGRLSSEGYIKLPSQGHYSVQNEGLRAIRQLPNEATREVIPQTAQHEYISQERLAELKNLHPADFDLQRLIRLCEEIDTSYRNECWHAVAALTREVLDHVPPIFNQRTFEQVANNYSGTKSFKDSMRHLQGSSRNIANAHLHTPIRRSESLPNRTQVNFAQDLDVLLGEIVRILR